MTSTIFSISIVSHSHKYYVNRLIKDLANVGRQDFEVILTLNLPEELLFNAAELPFDLKIIQNSAPKGFAANHNAAFAVSQSDVFVIMNPDIKLLDNPFDVLLSFLASHPRSICAPLIVNQYGHLEDSARHFPSPVLLFKKLLAKLRGYKLVAKPVPVRGDVLMPDWVAGMFIVVPRAIYQNLHGLSERYHMYYEDVDFCARVRQAGYDIAVCTRTTVIHEAQHDSHRKLRYLMWHLTSALKFFTSIAYLRIRLGRIWQM
jgi:N-acetylglucosaminyl-diphospho-decaprenol L-rhamnosyltransferase